MDAIVGYSGFVGTNLEAQHQFDARFNSKNIADIRGRDFKTLVCSAVPATMFVANRDPAADKQNIDSLFEHLSSSSAERMLLISTIAVYADASQSVDESATAFEQTTAYGRHRRDFEVMVAEAFEKVTILRLPALFGKGLKKNFIFDLLNPVPSFVTDDVFERALAVAGRQDQELIQRSFNWSDTAGMWAFDRGAFGAGSSETSIRSVFETCGVTAVNFTNPASRYQFYDLARLWDDGCRAMDHSIDVLNLATAPLSAADIYASVTGQKMPTGEAAQVSQDMRSRHCELWGRSDGYLYGAEEALTRLNAFCKNWPGSGQESQ